MLHLTTDAFDQMASWAREHLPGEKRTVRRLMVTHDA